jgi:monofunctional glycosyltransferase
VRKAARIAGWLATAAAVAFVAYELSILARLLWWRDHNPDSTAFMQARLGNLREKKPDAQLKLQWIPYARISVHLKRAVVAAEDARFMDHEGFDWEAIQKAWEKNQQRGRVVAGDPPSRSSLPRTCSCPGTALHGARPRRR